MTNIGQYQLFEKLKQSQLSFMDLSPEEKLLMSQTLRPTGEFNKQQRDLLKDWWLIVTDVEELESAITTHNETSTLKLGLPIRETLPITFSDELGWHDSGTSSNRRKKVIPADLLTDCRPEDAWGCIGEHLMGLVLTNISPDLFPLENTDLI